MAVQPETLDAYDDRRLVAAFQDGDEHAFSQIVGAHYHSLVAEARRRLRSNGDAEDAVQETLLRAYLALDRFGGEFRLRAWLSRILANACNDAMTRRSGELRLVNRLSHRRSEAPAADEDIGDSQLRAKIREAVESLPDSYRVAFVLRDIEERSYAEVAEKMSVTEPNARARVHRARSSLARTLRDTGGALGGFAISFRMIWPSWRKRGSRSGGQAQEAVGQRLARTTAGAVRAGHCAVPISATATKAGAAKPGLLGQSGRQAFVDLSSLSQAAVSSATQAPLSPLSSISEVITQVAASPISQTLLAAAPDAARASLPITGTIAAVAVAGVAMISSGGTLAPPPPASAPPSQQVTATAPPAASTPTSSIPATAPSTSTSIPTGPSAAEPAATSATTAAASVSGPGGAQAWSWLAPASTGTSDPSSAATNPSPAGGVTTAASLVACDLSQWFGGAATPSLPPAEPAGAEPSAFFSSDTLQTGGIDSAFVASGGGTFSDSSGVADLHAYYGACMGGTTEPGLGVQLSNPADPDLGVLQLTGALVSSATSDGNTFTLYRGTGTWIGGSGDQAPVGFAAQVELDEPSSLTSLRVAFFGADPGLSGSSAAAPSASPTPAASTDQSNPAPSAQPAAASSGQDPVTPSSTPAPAPSDPASTPAPAPTAGAAGPADPGSSAAARH